MDATDGLVLLGRVTDDRAMGAVINQDAWDVLMLFLIPVGGGIPAGVLLAKARGIAWPLMTLLYFISDVILACLFEPIIKTFVFLGRWIQPLAWIGAFFKKATQKSIAHYGTNSGPLALILIAFGVDPMTGRAAASAAGHGFVSGWMIAIAGDMVFYVLLMVSTLWLDNLLGDGTWTTIIIMALMIAIPAVVRRVRGAPGPRP